MTCEVCCSHTPSVAADCYELYKRSDYNKFKNILSKCHSEQLSEEASSTGRPVLKCRSFHELREN